MSIKTVCVLCHRDEARPHHIGKCSTEQQTTKEQMQTTNSFQLLKINCLVNFGKLNGFDWIWLTDLLRWAFSTFYTHFIAMILKLLVHARHQFIAFNYPIRCMQWMTEQLAVITAQCQITNGISVSMFNWMVGSKCCDGITVSFMNSVEIQSCTHTYTHSIWRHTKPLPFIFPFIHWLIHSAKNRIIWCGLMSFDVFFVLLITVAVAALGLGCHKAARITFNVLRVCECVLAQVFYCL